MAEYLINTNMLPLNFSLNHFVSQKYNYFIEKLDFQTFPKGVKFKSLQS